MNVVVNMEMFRFPGVIFALSIIFLFCGCERTLTEEPRYEASNSQETEHHQLIDHGVIIDQYNHGYFDIGYAQGLIIDGAFGEKFHSLQDIENLNINVHALVYDKDGAFLPICDNLLANVSRKAGKFKFVCDDDKKEFSIEAVEESSIVRTKGPAISRIDFEIIISKKIHEES